jgi:hypothetical protein
MRTQRVANVGACVDVILPGIAEFQELAGGPSSSQLVFHAPVDRDSKATSLIDAAAWLSGESDRVYPSSSSVMMTSVSSAF